MKVFFVRGSTMCDISYKRRADVRFWPKIFHKSFDGSIYNENFLRNRKYEIVSNQIWWLYIYYKHIVSTYLFWASVHLNVFPELNEPRHFVFTLIFRKIHIHNIHLNLGIGKTEKITKIVNLLLPFGTTTDVSALAL